MKDITKLLMHVNAVTAPHRHSQKIQKRDLDKLANFQIDMEKKYGLFGDENPLIKKDISNLSEILQALEESNIWLERLYDEFPIEGSMPLRSLIDRNKIILKGEL